MKSHRNTTALLIALSLAGGCSGESAHEGHEPHEGHERHGDGEHAAAHAAAAEGAEASEHAALAGHEGHDPLSAGQPLSGTSLFQLTSAFTDQAGQPFRFSSLEGHPTLIAMFYGSCRSVCPVLLHDVKVIDDALPPAQRARTRVLLITFDPENDTAESLQALAAEHDYDSERWSLLRGSDADIREVAMVLGVQYRRLEDGGYSHSALITQLNARGEIVNRIDGLGGDNSAVLAALSAD